MKRTWRVLLGLVMVLGFVTMSESQAEEREITLKEVPKVVKKAARKAVPGIKFTEAEVTTKGEHTRYELEGVADGKDYELVISAKGKVLKTEVDEDDHGHEGHDDDDDDDGHDDDDDDGHDDDGHDGHGHEGAGHGDGGHGH